MWIILTVTVLTVLSVAFVSSRQEKLYQASAKVLVSGFDSSQPADRFLQTQADIATASPEVARRVRNALGLGTTPPISVTPKIDSDILTFSSTAASPRLARAWQPRTRSSSETFNASLRLGTLGKPCETSNQR